MRIALLSLLLLAVGCEPSGAHESANELLSSCESFLSGLRQQGNEFAIRNDNPNAHECWGYIRAFQDMSAMVDDEGLTVTRACPPAESTGIQMVRVFVSYAQKHTPDLHQPAGWMALYAFRAAFPCPKR
jgi:hypothetical protein